MSFAIAVAAPCTCWSFAVAKPAPSRLEMSRSDISMRVGFMSPFGIPAAVHSTSTASPEARWIRTENG